MPVPADLVFSSIPEVQLEAQRRVVLLFQDSWPDKTNLRVILPEETCIEYENKALVFSQTALGCFIDGQPEDLPDKSPAFLEYYPDGKVKEFGHFCGGLRIHLPESPSIVRLSQGGTLIDSDREGNVPSALLMRHFIDMQSDGSPLPVNVVPGLTRANTGGPEFPLSTGPDVDELARCLNDAYGAIVTVDAAKSLYLSASQQYPSAPVTNHQLLCHVPEALSFDDGYATPAMMIDKMASLGRKPADYWETLRQLHCQFECGAFGLAVDSQKTLLKLAEEAYDDCPAALNGDADEIPLLGKGSSPAMAASHSRQGR